METKTIKCSNVKEKEGQYGPSLQIGHKVGDEWVNYFVNDAALFDYFKKGASVTIEYEKKGNWNIVKGVSTAASGGNGNGSSGGYVEEPGKQKSIELQVVVKAVAEMYSGKDLSAHDFAAYVTSVWTDVFSNPLDALKAKAQESLDADEDDDQVPF